MFDPDYKPTPIEQVEIPMPSDRARGFAFLGVVVSLLICFAIARFG